ncbi:ArsR/SmtB family transcription factor [Evansella tamaricis]|uniref:Winged helix-turn-helix domain-containing protein n=1 Tax=Evansella tamaricis TaxID=2069301 RepID=A0ABS6JL09_9BACI|nr:winged helix-turn-helix domain-containing protein [Evansella tamaricis]MBU9714364.1 winged helix-turn-helix domain-containing protein [Evansella tamaricis]
MGKVENFTFVSTPVVDLLVSMLMVVNHERISSEEDMEHKELYSVEIKEWVRKTREQLPKDMLEELQIFFNYESYFGITLVPLIINEKVYADIHTFLSFLHQLNDEDLYFAFTHTGYGPEKERMIDFKDPNEVISFLKELNLPEQEKWKLSYLIFDGERTKTRLIKLIERFYYQYYQPMEKFSNSKQLDHAGLLEGELNQGNDTYFRELLSQHGIEWSKTKDIHFFVSYFFDTSILFADVHKNNMDITAFILGTNHYNVFNVGRGEKETLEAIRIITDEKRFKVLQLLKVRPLYGYELAQELGVSNSTVSHHLSTLVKQHLVRSIRRENKVYFEVNRDEIQNILRQLEKMLTE